jgi:hypothetical protein
MNTGQLPHSEGTPWAKEHLLVAVFGLQLRVFGLEEGENFLGRITAEVGLKDVAVASGAVAEPHREPGNGGLSGDVTNTFGNFADCWGDDFLHAGSMPDAGGRLNSGVAPLPSPLPTGWGEGGFSLGPGPGGARASLALGSAEMIAVREGMNDYSATR